MHLTNLTCVVVVIAVMAVLLAVILLPYLLRGDTKLSAADLLQHNRDTWAGLAEVLRAVMSRMPPPAH